jgi:hypothetical protein
MSKRKQVESQLVPESPLQGEVCPENKLKKRILAFIDECRMDKELKSKDHELLDVIEGECREYYNLLLRLDCILNDGNSELVIDSDGEEESDSEWNMDEDEEPINRDPTVSLYTLDECRKIKAWKERNWSLETIKQRIGKRLQESKNPSRDVQR